METSILALEHLIQGFRLSCQAEGKSPRTVEWYTAFLLRFLRFLQSNSLPTILGYIDKGHIRAFIRYLQTEAKTPHKGMPLSGHTVQGYVRTLKAFYSWTVREEHIKDNPMTRIPVPRAPIKVINTFSLEQLSSLVNLCDRSNGRGYRNLAIILLLLDSGIRVSELVGIEIEDVSLAEGYIKIKRAKGNKERIVPIGSLVQK